MSFNPFRKKQPKNPLDAFSEEDLRLWRKKLEFGREKVLRRINELEAEKVRLLHEGARSDQRLRRAKAYQVKAVGEQITHLDAQLDAVALQLQNLTRLSFLKQNQSLPSLSVVDDLLGKVDVAELRRHVEDQIIHSEAEADRNLEISRLFDEVVNQGPAPAADSEIAAIEAEMERLAMGDLPEVPVEPRPREAQADAAGGSADAEPGPRS